MKLLIIFTAVILLNIGSINGQEVILDDVIGGWDDGGATKIVANCDVSFIIRASNDGVKEGGLSTGFRIYGPSSFTPVSIDTIPSYLFPYSWTEMFSFVLNPLCINCDGIGADTVGLSVAGFPSDAGLPVGFNEQILSINTGGVAPGETLCLDSSWFPPAGEWRWGSGAIPSWDGPHCFTAEIPNCLPASIESPPDTIWIDSCRVASHQFLYSCFGSFEILNGPGMITPSGLYTLDLDIDTYAPTIKIGIVDKAAYCGQLTDSCEVVFAFTPGFSTTLGDMDQNCQLDISDLLIIVDYMFTPNPDPIDESLADMNDDGQLDITDLLFLVDYMFSPPE